MYRLRQFILFICDLAALSVGLFLALNIRYLAWPTLGKYLELYPSMLFLFIILAVILFISGAYDLNQTKNNWNFFQKILVSLPIWLMVGVLYFYLRPGNQTNPKTILILTAICGLAFVTIWRFWYNRSLSTALLKTNVVFAGVCPEITDIISVLRSEPQRGYCVLGIIANGGEIVPSAVSDLPLAFTLESLVQKNSGQTPQLIVVTPQLNLNGKLTKELYDRLFQEISIVEVHKFYEEIIGRVSPAIFSEGWFLRNLHDQRKKIYDRARILIDYVCAVLMSIVFLITFPFIALAIKLNSKGPIFIIQNRVGRLGKIFKIRKYRTMLALSPDGSAETNGPQFAAVNDQRVTSAGKFLRRTRLDELPQFINILKNEMSIVGPRPERPEFAAELTKCMPFYSMRHLVKPGLTGWAQLQKNYYGTIDENLRKLEYDLYYVKNRSFLLDVVIILKTVSIILGMKGR